MKLKNKLKFTAIAATLAAPLVTLPLVNAVKATNEPDVVQTNIKDVTIEITGKSNYTVSFVQSKYHPEWKTYATIKKMHIDNSDVIENLEIPEAVNSEEGGYYELRTIDTDGGTTGAGRIKRLDLSKAKNLVEISKSAFGDATFKIGFVNFKGATNLEIIHEEAFAHQYFDSSLNINDNIWDFTDTNLKEIREEAFYQCCDDNKNDFNAIILPPTLKKVGANAFSTGNEKCRIRFHKVIFTDTNPSDDLFTNGIPRIIDKDGLGICVPMGCGEKYKKLKHFDRTYAKNVYESTIQYTPAPETVGRGSLWLSVPVNSPGMDEKDWFPVSSTKQKIKDGVKLFLVNDHNYRLTLDDEGHLHWSGNILPGEYKTRVCAAKYDDAEGKKLSFIISEEITICVFRPKLTGGSKNLFATLNTKGQDDKNWKVDISGEGVSHPIESVNWKIIYQAPELKNCINVHSSKDKNEAYIEWNAIDKVGTFNIILGAEVQDNWAENKYLVTQDLFISVTEFGKINVQYSIDGTSFMEYDGHEIKLNDQFNTVKFKIIMPTGTGTEYTISDPEVSIDNVSLSHSTGEWILEVSKDAFKKPGLAQFYIHSSIEDKQGNLLDFYAPNDIKVSYNYDSSEFSSDIPNEIDITKTLSGSHTYKIVNPGYGEITNIKYKSTPWHEDSRIGNLLTFEPSEDKQSVVVNWSDKYSPLGIPFDVSDVMLDITIEDPKTNEERIVHQSVSIVATNTSEVIYDAETTTIDAGIGQTTTSDSPFVFKLNGAISGYNTSEWGCTCENETLAKCISMESSNGIKGDYAYLKCDLAEITTEQAKGLKGLHDVVVYAVDEDNLTGSYMTVQLNVGYKVSILDCPQKIETTTGTSGRTEKPLITMLGNEVASKPTYKIDGLGNKVWVDTEGHICWSGDIPAGSHPLTLTSTVKVGEDTYSTTITFTLIVTQGSGGGTNVGAIVGGTVGGTVAAGGAATGITLGVKKSKSPKGKKK